jgi:hypothetical protein
MSRSILLGLLGCFITIIFAEDLKKDELVNFLTYKYVRQHLKLPLTDDIQFFGYSDKITKSVCAVMEMAALSGWKYQLIGPNITFSQHLDDVKTNKLIVLASIVDALPNNTVVIFADSFDTVIQGSMDQFRRDFSTVLSISTEKAKWSDVVIYNAEKNCWPYRHWNEREYCEIIQGSRYISSQSKMVDPEGPHKKWSNPGMAVIEPNEVMPLTCTRQESLIPTQYKSTTPYKYLNSGLAAGRVSAYKGF